MRILVFQHLDVEHSGIFGTFWRQDGHSEHVVELDAGDAIPPLDDFDLLAVMGGPMDVWQEDAHPWLVPEKAAIRRWVRDLRRPYLGVCLGHQLLASALGGTVGLMQRPEVGICDVAMTDAGRDDPIFAGVPVRMTSLQWHGAEVSALPEGGIVLAQNAACPVQAMRWGDRAYGFQYHLEATPRTVADWAAIPEYKESLERTLGAGAAERLKADLAPLLRDIGTVARRINDNLMAIAAA